MVCEALLRLVEGGPDEAFPADAYGLEVVLLPRFIPIAVGDECVGVVEGYVGQGEGGEQLRERLSVVCRFREVGAQTVGLRQEALEADRA